MQSAQVSVWVPIAVALVAGVFGLVGVIVGQVINGRRAQREFALQSTVETQRHWRDTKLEVFADFIQVFHRWYMVLEPAVVALVDNLVMPDAEVIKQLRDLEAEMRAPLARVYLVSSGTLQEAAELAVRCYQEGTTALENGSMKRWWPPAKVPKDDIPLEEFYRLLKLMRHELSLQS